VTWTHAGASQGRAYLRCASRWWFEYVAGIKPPATDALRFGRIVHAIVERCLRDRVPVESVARVHLDGDDHDVAPPHLTVAARLVAATPPGDYTASDVEQRFSDLQLAAPVELRGTIDAITIDPDGALHVIDHKTTAGLDWAPTATEIPTHFQALLYVAHIARARQHVGPVRFSFNVAEKRHPYRAEVRSHLFSAADVAEAASFVADTARAMAEAAALPVERVAYNLDACRDYTSAKNPDGCPFRQRCAQLGRPTKGALSTVYAIGKDPEMPDQLTALLAAPPTRSGRQTKRNRVISQILEIDPTIARAQLDELDDVDTALKGVERERRHLTHEIATLSGGATEPERAAWLSSTLGELREIRDGIARPRDLRAMTRDEIVAEIRQSQDLSDGDIAPYSDDQLRTALGQLRSEAATADHAINAPEAIAADLDLDAVEQTAPKKRGRKPTAPTITVDGETHKLSRAKRAELFAWLRSRNVEPPSGRGCVTRAREIIAGMLAGEPAPPEQATIAPAPVEPAPVEPASVEPAPVVPVEPAPVELIGPAAAQTDLDTVLDEIAARRAQLGIGDWAFARPGNSLAATDANIRAAVEHVDELRERCDAIGHPAAAEAIEQPIDPIDGSTAALTASSSFSRIPGFDLFVNCRPDSGVSRDLDRLVERFGAALAERGQAPHYLALEYNKGPRQVAAMVAGALAGDRVSLAGAVYVTTRTATGQALIDVLTPLAREIVRGDS